jgi:hypothetical protein
MARDLRKYARQTGVRLTAGALLLLFIVGDGLIYFIYGKSAAIFGLLCILAGMVPIILTIGVLLLVDWARKRLNHDE